MAETVDVRALLAQPTNEAERPRALPDGHYNCTIIGHEFDRTKGETQTAYIRYNFKVDGPTEDVVDSVEGIDFDRVQVRKDFFITPRALYRHTDFLDAVLGFEEGRGHDARIPDTQGAKVICEITEQMDRKTNKPTGYNDVGAVVAA